MVDRRIKAAELPEFDPARYLNDDGSATGFLKALGDRAIAEALAENRVPEALATGESEALHDFLKRRAGYLIYP